MSRPSLQPSCPITWQKRQLLVNKIPLWIGRLWHYLENCLLSHSFRGPIFFLLKTRTPRLFLSLFPLNIFILMAVSKNPEQIDFPQKLPGTEGWKLRLSWINQEIWDPNIHCTLAFYEETSSCSLAIQCPWLTGKIVPHSALLVGWLLTNQLASEKMTNKETTCLPT